MAQKHSGISDGGHFPIIIEDIYLKKKKNEALEVKKALTKKVHYIGSNDGNIFWNRIINDLKTKEAIPRDIDFVRTHRMEWPLINSERPDVIYEDEKNIVGIEYFKFDSSRKNRNGSSLLREQARLEKSLLSRYYKTGERYLVEKNDSDLSYQNYIKSAVSAFQKHKNNVAEYKKNLSIRAPQKRITIVFFIDDVTILGNYAITERGKEEPLRILYVKEFLDELSTSPDLDYIISRGQVKYYYCESIIMELTSDVLAKQYKEIYDNKKIVFCSEKSWTVQSIGDGLKESD